MFAEVATKTLRRAITGICRPWSRQRFYLHRRQAISRQHIATGWSDNRQKTPDTPSEPEGEKAAETRLHIEA